MSKMPNDAITKLHTQPLEDWVIVDVEWKNFPILNEVAHLPANTTGISQLRNHLSDHTLLICEILFNGDTLLITLAYIVGGVM